MQTPEIAAFAVEFVPARVDMMNVGRRGRWESIEEFSAFRSSLGAAIGTPNPPPGAATRVIEPHAVATHRDGDQLEGEAHEDTSAA